MADETNRDKALRGVAVKVTDGRLQEMRTQAIRNEGIPLETVYHWHWAAALNELVEARAEIERLRAVIRDAASHIEYLCPRPGPYHPKFASLLECASETGPKL